jgi:hypothetical protein
MKPAMSPRPSEEEAILDEFVTEEEMTLATLRRYIDQHPSLAASLLNLYHELRLQAAEPAEGSHVHQEAGPILKADGADAALAALSGSGLRAVAERLGLPRAFFVGFRDRRIEFTTIPGRFVVNLASALGVSTDQLVSHLTATDHPMMRVAFRADEVPEIPSKTDFPSYMDAAGLTEEQRGAVRALAEKSDQSA